jgi:hypothetical protein
MEPYEKSYLLVVGPTIPDIGYQKDEVLLHCWSHNDSVVQLRCHISSTLVKTCRRNPRGTYVNFHVILDTGSGKIDVMHSDKVPGAQWPARPIARVSPVSLMGQSLVEPNIQDRNIGWKAVLKSRALDGHEANSQCHDSATYIVEISPDVMRILSHMPWKIKVPTQSYE